MFIINRRTDKEYYLQERNKILDTPSDLGFDLNNLIILEYDFAKNVIQIYNSFQIHFSYSNLKES